MGYLVHQREPEAVQAVVAKGKSDDCPSRNAEDGASVYVRPRQVLLDDHRDPHLAQNRFGEDGSVFHRAGSSKPTHEREVDGPSGKGRQFLRFRKVDDPSRPRFQSAQVDGTARPNVRGPSECRGRKAGPPQRLEERIESGTKLLR